MTDRYPTEVLPCSSVRIVPRAEHGNCSMTRSGGQGQLPFLTYLYRVLLHLLAFGAVAAVARLGVSVFAAMTIEAATESNTGKQGQ